MAEKDRQVLNCGNDALPGQRLLRPCPKRWGELTPTDEEGIRYCGTCDHRVYRVANRFEARIRAQQGECLAVPPTVFATAHQQAARHHAEEGLVRGQFSDRAFIDTLFPD